MRALVRPTSECHRLQAIGIEVAQGNLLDLPSLEAAIQGCDTLYHVASIYQWCVPDKKVLYEVNVTGTKNLLLAALEAGVKRAVYTSICLTIGAAKGEMSKEDTTHWGYFLSDYERPKYQAEREAMALCQRGLSLVCVNPGGVFGPGDFKTLGRFIIGLLSGRRPFFMNSEVSLAYIDDVVRGHILAAEKGRSGQRYLLTGENTTLAAVLQTAAGLAGVPYQPRPLPYWLVYILASLMETASLLTKRPSPLARDAVRNAHHGARFDNTRAQVELGLAFTPLEEGLRRAIQWYREKGYIPLPGRKEGL